MKLIILGTLLLIALGFFVLAYFMNDTKRGAYALLSGFIIVLLTGILIAGFGLEYQKGTVTTEDLNSTSTIIGNDTLTTGTNTITETYEYNTLNALERTILSLPLILAGFWGVLVVATAVKESRYEEQ